MTFDIKESSPCVIALSVKTEADEIQPVYDAVLRVFLREMTLPGFRKGKIPLPVIKQKFHDDIIRECQDQCLRAFYEEARKRAGLQVVYLNGFTDLSFVPGVGFSFTANVEVKPKIKLPEYKNLKLEYLDTTVSEEQVTERIENFRKAFAKYEDAKEGEVITNGDLVEFDYDGMLDDEAKTPLSEVVPDQKVIHSGKNFWVQLEEGRFLPELLEALNGMKVGESKTGVAVQFPEESAPDALKGKKCLYDITVRGFRRCSLPDDAAFLESAKVESFDELRKQFRELLERDAVNADITNRKNQVVFKLLDGADFDVPPTVVQNQMHEYLQNLAQQVQYQGVSPEYIEQNRDRILKEAEESAISQVRFSYIMIEIADREHLEVTEEDIMNGLKQVAANSNGKYTMDDLKKQLKERHTEEEYTGQLRAEKALDFVLNAAAKN